MSRIFRFWFPVGLYSVIIFVVSSINKVSIPVSGLHFDKVLHIIEYFPLGYLLAMAFAQAQFSRSMSTVIFWSAVGCAFIYGCSDEWHQSFVIGRTASFLDVCADFVGASLGAFSYLRLKKDVVLK